MSQIKLSSERACKKFYFPNSEERNIAKEILDETFPDVKFTSLRSSELLLNLTGSHLYDTKVMAEINRIGGKLSPAIR